MGVIVVLWLNLDEALLLFWHGEGALDQKRVLETEWLIYMSVDLDEG